MEKLFVLVFALTLLAFSSDASPILTEKQAKQLLRSRRQDRPNKPGFPDEPMRVKVDHKAPASSGSLDMTGCISVVQVCSYWVQINHTGFMEYMHHLLALEHRAEEQFLEHWLNPHCKPHCDRNIVHPV